MENSQHFFELFKSQRESKNISIKDIVDYTKIDKKYIEAIESGDFTLAPNVYIRLFIKSYCEFIELDYKKALDDYEIYTTGKIDKKIDTPASIDVNSDSANRIAGNEDDLSSEFNSKSLIGILGIIVVVIILLIFINNVKDSNPIDKSNSSDNLQSEEQNYNDKYNSSNQSKASESKDNQKVPSKVLVDSTNNAN